LARLLDQLDLREPVDDLETPLGLRLRCSPSSPIGSAPRRGDERNQYTVGVDAKAVIGQQCAVQRSKDEGVDAAAGPAKRRTGGVKESGSGAPSRWSAAPGPDPGLLDIRKYSSVLFAHCK
jgi:hypothetical protein